MEEMFSQRVQKYVKDILKFVENLGIGEIATLSGRYFSLTVTIDGIEQKSYDLMVNRIGNKFEDPLKLLIIIMKKV